MGKYRMLESGQLGAGSHSLPLGQSESALTQTDGETPLTDRAVNVPEMPWYVVQTKPRQERIAEENLSRQGYHCYLPRIKAVKISRNRETIQLEPLFPGYVFFQPSHPEHSIAPVRSTLGVLKIVRFGEEFAVLRPETLESIKQFEARQYSLKYEEITPIKNGAIVCVTDGPLAGLEGLVSAVSEKRVVVLFHLLGHDMQVRLSPCQLRLAG